MGKSTSEDTVDSNSVKLDFGLYAKGVSEEARKSWPLDFGLVYSVTLSKDSLQTVVNVRNEGDESFEFQFLLHTYLRINVSFLLLSRLMESPENVASESNYRSKHLKMAPNTQLKRVHANMY